ncbi:hypothetical protein FOZ60_013110 [Perkinsus olseni]|uniref:Uncharacterized protein n=1 Tax=Perkinsus olseni TaxID=32597 RepID=A0A7J6N9X6_PEROL|nr:hypothetical protein FOZ60_013110 [Perkinsus olseni]
MCHQTTTRFSTTSSGLNDVSINYHQVKRTTTTADIPVTLLDNPETPEGRCCIKIPWKHPTSRPPNFKAAYAKDCAITRRLSDEQQRPYAEAIDALVRDDIVEERSAPSCTHYVMALPLFGAEKPTHLCSVCLDAGEFNECVDVSAVGGNGEGSLWFLLLAWRTAPFYEMPFGFGHSPHGLRSSLNWPRRQWEREVKLKAGQKAAPNDVAGDNQMVGSDGPLLEFDVPVDAEDEVTATVGDPNSGDDQEEHDESSLTIKAPSTRPAKPVPLGDPPQEEPLPVPSSIDLVLYVDDLCRRGQQPATVAQQGGYVKWKLCRHGSDVSDPKVFNNFSPCPTATYRSVLGYQVEIGSDVILFRYEDFRNTMATWLCGLSLQQPVLRHVEISKGIFIYCDAARETSVQKKLILTDSAINLHGLRKTSSAKAKLGRFEQLPLKIVEDIIQDLNKQGIQAPYYEVLPKGSVARIVTIDVDSTDGAWATMLAKGRPCWRPCLATMSIVDSVLQGCELGLAQLSS